ncbi:hypothetical protein [Vreelandella massiliensis]|uniref:hypothetical protein n=1 Tax=Vreelandella massiliensis TaxID=1816686 RepID=UPI00096A53F6|nr:hypothetical protein [Halomonas massiliensis]
MGWASSATGGGYGGGSSGRGGGGGRGTGFDGRDTPGPSNTPGGRRGSNLGADGGIGRASLGRQSAGGGRVSANDRLGRLIGGATAPPPKPSGYQDDGSYHLNTNVSDDQANDMAARISREQFERYMESFAPQEEALADTLDNTNAQDAASTATADAQRSRAALERMRQRYGTSLTGGQQQAESRQSQRSTTLGALSALNTGREMDEDRNFNIKGTMLNIGNNLSSSAMGGLTESAQNSSARQRSYQQAKAQHSAQKSQQTAQTIGTIATIAALAM